MYNTLEKKLILGKMSSVLVMYTNIFSPENKKVNIFGQYGTIYITTDRPTHLANMVLFILRQTDRHIFVNQLIKNKSISTHVSLCHRDDGLIQFKCNIVLGKKRTICLKKIWAMEKCQGICSDKRTPNFVTGQ